MCIYCVCLFVHSEYVFHIICAFMKSTNNSHCNMAESLCQKHESAEMLDIHCTSPLKMNCSCFDNDLVLMFKTTQKVYSCV